MAKICQKSVRKATFCCLRHINRQCCIYVGYPHGGFGNFDYVGLRPGSNWVFPDGGTSLGIGGGSTFGIGGGSTFGLGGGTTFGSGYGHPSFHQHYHEHQVCKIEVLTREISQFIARSSFHSSLSKIV